MYYIPRQSSKVSLFSCLCLYFTVFWAKLKQLTLFSSSSCLFSSSVCCVKDCLLLVNWEINDSFSSSCCISSSNEKTLFFFRRKNMDRHIKFTWMRKEIIWKEITRYNVAKRRESNNLIPPGRKKLSKMNTMLASKERGWADCKNHTLVLVLLGYICFFGWSIHDCHKEEILQSELCSDHSVMNI